MTDADALLAATLADPAEDVPRLAFADVCEEAAGEMTCPRCKGKRDWHDALTGDGRCFDCRGTGRCSNGYAERAELIRESIRLEGLKHRRTELFNSETDWKACTSVSANWCPNCGDCSCPNPEQSKCDPQCPLHAPDSPHDQWSELDGEITTVQARVAALVAACRDLREIPGLVFHGMSPDGELLWRAPNQEPHELLSLIRGTVRRGWVDSLRMPVQSFTREVAAAVWACQPITGVEFAAVGPFFPGRGVGFGWYREGGTGSYGVHHESNLPQQLFDELRGYQDEEIGNYKYFPTREAAITALSDAAVRLGRAWAGLSPMTTACGRSAAGVAAGGGAGRRGGRRER